MTSRSPIRVLLVEDSPVVLLILKRIFSSTPEIEVVGTAQNGKEGLALIPRLQPTVICTDFYMPQMNGLEFTKEVMRKFPRPILVISASVQKDDTQNIFRMLDAGAVDVFPKPRAGLDSNYESIKQELINKIKVLAGVAVFTRWRRESSYIADPSPVPQIAAKPQTILPEPNRDRQRGTPILPKSVVPVRLHTPVAKILAIGASTGDTQALHQILAHLPANFGVPVICVQHISDGFLQGLIDWLALECRLPVKIAMAGEFPQAGHIYFPVERRHLELDAQGRFIYSSSVPVGGHCPAVTVTLKSIANFYGRATVGILLTGMGRDGADGMAAIAQAGGVTIAQDEASCVIFGMPKEAIALGVVQHILPLGAIAPYLLSHLFI